MTFAFCSGALRPLHWEGIHKQQRCCYPAPNDVTTTPRRRYAPRTDDGLAMGMESAGTLIVFLGLGWLIDRVLGTQPVFMIIMVVLAMVGKGAKMYATYTTRMKELEAKRVEGRPTGSPS